MRLKKAAIQLLVTLVTLVLIFPVVYMIILSFRPPSLLYGLTSLLSTELTTENYSNIFYMIRTGAVAAPLVKLRNSVVYTLGSTLIVSIIGILAGYVLARHKFPGNKLVNMSLLVCQLLPETQTIIPVYYLFLKANLLDTALGVILVFTAGGAALNAWLMASYIRSIPIDLDEAAFMDGCSEFGVIYRIILPLAAPGMVAASVLTFIGSWGDFLWVLTLTSSEELKTLPVLIVQILQQPYQQTWGALFALSVISTIPVVVFFLILQKYLIRGLTAGALTG